MVLAHISRTLRRFPEATTPRARKENHMKELNIDTPTGCALIYITYQVLFIAL